MIIPFVTLWNCHYKQTNQKQKETNKQALWDIQYVYAVLTFMEIYLEVYCPLFFNMLQKYVYIHNIIYQLICHLIITLLVYDSWSRFYRFLNKSFICLGHTEFENHISCLSEKLSLYYVWAFSVTEKWKTFVYFCI